jgi:hypothetical protein
MRIFPIILALAALIAGCHTDEVRRIEAERTGCLLGAVEVEPSCERDYYVTTNHCTGERHHYGCDLELPWLESDCLRGVPLCAYPGSSAD